ncbi:hypothetical protein Zm00014a_015146 [Zea mays]|uniref:Uncharacterized protein n=2 Tax=Zea mays TaxID=4577 RepID=A0A3L6DYB3_MAIZE|nr:hypothetical protein Zm00014a_034074 [Zea mays]PWZ37543.1 hypothetical protein Zm00014a_013169 [Zea mays]PWZ38386.1 hypothetical protein Zm00014a_015146 [Zea mays]
MGGLGLPYG